MAVKAGDTHFMLINSNHSLGRQHFSICHELYHLYIQEDFTPHHCSSGTFNRSNTMEYRADMFAAYLLIPKDGIVALIPDDELEKDVISLATILKIEHFYSYSRTALLNRLIEIGLLTKQKADSFRTNIKKSARKYGYDVSLYSPANENLVIGDFGSMAKKLFDNEKISEVHYSELMNSIGFDALNNDQADEID